MLLSPPRKRARSFIWKKRNLLNPRMFCAKFVCNWPGGFGEEVSNVFALCSYYMYLTLTKGIALHLNKIESSWPRNDLGQVWWNLTPWFQRSSFEHILLHDGLGTSSGNLERLLLYNIIFIQLSDKNGNATRYIF